MQKKHRRPPSVKLSLPPQSDQSGFTLVELLISLIIFMIVVGAIYGLLEVSRSGRSVTNKRVEAMQNVRNALNAIGRDALNAGFNHPVNGALLPAGKLSPLLGGVPVLNNSTTAIPIATADFLTPIIAGNDRTVNDLSKISTDQITFAFQDVTFNNNQSLIISSISTNGSTLTISEGASNAACRANDIYLIAGTNNQSVGVMTASQNNDKILFANGDALGLNNPNLLSPPNFIRAAGAPASLTRINLVTYRVLADGTLVRTVYGNNPTVARQDTPLAFNVEDLIIKYVLEDGTVSLNPIPAQFVKIRQIEVTIVVRSPEAGSQGNQAGAAQPHKVTLVSSFNTRNIGYADK